MSLWLPRDHDGYKVSKGLSERLLSLNRSFFPATWIRVGMGGLMLGKCWGNGSQSMDSEATIGLDHSSGGLNQGRYGRANAREMLGKW